MKYLFLLGYVAVASPVWAQDATAVQAEADDADVCAGTCMTTRIREDAQTILVTGAPTNIYSNGQSISVVGRDELDRIQGADLTRVLERLPGVSLSRNGGLGSQTGLNVRGANADQVLVLVDGIRIADYASPGGGYDLGNLLAGDLDRVELLRGSNSVIWGSQAIGGVLAVQTRETGGFAGSAEYGAYDTLLTNASVGVSGDSFAASLSGGYARTDGFSAQAGGTEADGYEQWHVSGRARANLSETLTLRAVGRFADSHLGIDLTGPDGADFQNTREITGRIGLDYQGDGLLLTAGISHADVRRAYESGWGPSDFTGRSWRAELRGRADVSDTLRLDFGADTDWTRAVSTYDPAATARQSSGHALLGWHSGGTSLAAGARIDDHETFGTHATFGANASHDLGGGWRLRASYGEGFKAPTLYQLYGGYVGNAALQPETSRSYDAGLEKGDRNANLHLALMAFRRDSRNLIDLDSGFVYQNVAEARAQGVELELGTRITPQFRAQVAYTYLEARDITQARDLARRPRHALALSADWETPLAGLALGADLRLQGDSVEYDYLGTPTRLDGFAVTTLRASLPLGAKLDLYGRVENVGNVKYQTAAGFNTPGRSAYAGIRARF